MSARRVPTPADYAADEILRDGSSIHIRAIRPDDRDRLLEHFRRLSARSLYQRFFGFRRAPTGEELAALTQLDFVGRIGMVATLGQGDSERFIGVGQCVRLKDRSRAEVAFAVLDEYQGRGIGTLLLENLSRIARQAGIDEVEADVLGDNNRMLEVFAKSGFRVTRSVDEGVVHLSFPTTETEQFVEASLARERLASAQSVARILRPSSVAVLGASRNPRKIGGAILANLLRDGFNGPIYPVNPAAREVQGLSCHPTLEAIDQPVDLAVIAVPAAAVERELANCARAGVHSVVVITSGFAEASEAGRAIERRIVELVRSAGMRMVGPNCMGVVNTDPEVRLNATFAPLRPPRGNIGMFSQSGALGIAILDYVRARHLGLSSFVSAGNRADVSSNDLICYWAEDPRTAVIALYLEAVGNPRKFGRLAREVAVRKPIVAVKSGRSAAGSRAASSHSASLANLDAAVDALFEQAGVIRAETLDELLDVTAMLSAERVPAGPRVGVISNAGGPGILLADACEARGLKLPALDVKTLDELRSFLPAVAGLSNPIDMTAAAGAAEFERTLAAVGNDANVDSVVALYVPPMITRPEEVATGIAQGAAKVPSEKPVLNVFLSFAGPPTELHGGPRGPLPSYNLPENAAVALAAAHRYGQWRRRPRGEAYALGSFAHGVVRAVAERVLADAPGPRWLSFPDLATILRAAGVEVALAEQVEAAQAPARADRVGYPLVAKAIAPGLLHKSDVGGVIMGLNSAEAVADAVATLERRMDAIGKQLTDVLLQPEVTGGVETLVGVVTDPTFGPLLVCGLGGVLVELMKDVSFRLHPVTDVDAGEMLAGLRASRLLDGYRGSPPADRNALISVILRVSALVEALPELRELDLNPVKVLEPGKGAVVLDGRMLLRPVSAPSPPAKT